MYPAGVKNNIINPNIKITILGTRVKIPPMTGLNQLINSKIVIDIIGYLAVPKSQNLGDSSIIKV